MCIRYSSLFWVYFKNHGETADNFSIKIYANKIKHRITFNIKTGYYLELSTPETVKLLGSTKIKMTEDGNIKNVSHLEITEVVLV